MPIDTIPTFRTLVRVCIIAAAALAGPGLAVAEEAKISSDGFRQVRVAPALATNTRFMQLIMPFIGNHPEADEGRPTLSLDVRPGKSGLVFDLKMGGYLDDSVSGEHYRGHVVASPDGWKLESLGVKPTCYRGEPREGRCP